MSDFNKEFWHHTTPEGHKGLILKLPSLMQFFQTIFFMLDIETGSMYAMVEETPWKIDINANRYGFLLNMLEPLLREAGKKLKQQLQDAERSFTRMEPEHEGDRVEEFIHSTFDNFGVMTYHPGRLLNKEERKAMHTVWVSFIQRICTLYELMVHNCERNPLQQNYFVDIFSRSYDHLFAALHTIKSIFEVDGDLRRNTQIRQVIFPNNIPSIETLETTGSAKILSKLEHELYQCEYTLDREDAFGDPNMDIEQSQLAPHSSIIIQTPGGTRQQTSQAPFSAKPVHQSTTGRTQPQKPRATKNATTTDSATARRVTPSQPT